MLNELAAIILHTYVYYDAVDLTLVHVTYMSQTDRHR